jgi:lipoate-protein ligase A
VAPTWRLLSPIHADGALQMALDSWLLDQLQAGASGPCLRFYTWSRPTLSLGFHQRRLEPHWLELVTAGVIDLVRRPTGGRAVLHGSELTYSLVQTCSTTRRRDAYVQACGWLQQAFADLGLPLGFGSAAISRGPQRGSCFASGSAADLIHANGAKRIGSAQLWRGPALLQHGSVLLDPPQGLWQELFGELPPDLPPLYLSAEQLMERLEQAAQLHLCGGALRREPFRTAELEQVEPLAQRYRGERTALLASSSPPGSCTSPLASIERTTGPRDIPSG